MYETFYGLSGKPFQLNPDPAFFFGSRGHKRAFAYLQYGVYQSEGFIVVTGEVGAGKTTIVRNLFENLDRGRLVAAQIVSTQLDADDLLRSVATAFGLPMRAVDKATLLASLEAFLCKLAIDGKRALLVVDEAQNLSPRAIEELRMLSNFQLGEHALLQSFLIGQPELRDMMQGAQMSQLRQRVIASYHLGPLDRNETQAYIEHRLRHVGWNNDPRFEPSCFDSIHTWSGGIPRRINTLCNRLMLAGFPTQVPWSWEEDFFQAFPHLSESDMAKGRYMYSAGRGAVTTDPLLSGSSVPEKNGLFLSIENWLSEKGLL